MWRSVGILLVSLTVVACEKDGATVDPDLVPLQVSIPPDDEIVEGDAANSPGEEPVNADAGKEEKPADAVAEAEASGEQPLEGYQALELAESAAGEAMSSPSYVIAPAMPVAWPPASEEVVFFVYPLDPTKSDVTKYKCGAAVVGVHLNLATRETTVEKLPKAKALGTLSLDRGITVDDPIHRGQEALFEVSLGKATAQKRLYLLKRYSAWLDAHPLLAKDLRKRAPDFIALVTE